VLYGTPGTRCRSISARVFNRGSKRLHTRLVQLDMSDSARLARERTTRTTFPFSWLSKPKCAFVSREYIHRENTFHFGYVFPMFRLYRLYGNANAAGNGRFVGTTCAPV
jgi:hypothetical protein